MISYGGKSPEKCRGATRKLGIGRGAPIGHMQVKRDAAGVGVVMKGKEADNGLRSDRSSREQLSEPRQPSC
jgi:hypothetical protein